LNANVISFGGAVVGEHLAEEIVKTFLAADYLGEDDDLVKKIDAVESKDNPDQHDNPHFYDHEMKLWDEGFYHD